MAPAATTAPARTMNTNWRPVPMIRWSRRWIPSAMVATPRAAAMNPRVIPPKPSAPFTACRSPAGRRWAVLRAVLDHEPVGFEPGGRPGVAFDEPALADDRGAVLEQVAGVAAVEDRGGLPAFGDLERDPLAGRDHGAGDDRPRHAQAAAVVGRVLLGGHRLRDCPEVHD